MGELELKEFEKEKKEHPEFSDEQIWQIVKDHKKAGSEGFAHEHKYRGHEGFSDGVKKGRESFTHDVESSREGAKGAVFKLASTLKPKEKIKGILDSF